MLCRPPYGELQKIFSERMPILGRTICPSKAAHTVAAAYRADGERILFRMKTFYEIMHGDDKVASISTDGRCEIYMKGFMPYNLYPEAEEDFDTLFNNLADFYFWCASRMLTLDRIYAKEILNSIGASQLGTDREQAQIALSYHCLCLTDIYWVKRDTENISFKSINLFENHLSNAFIDVVCADIRCRLQTAI